MSEPQPRRSSKTIDPEASLAARLGFEIRRRRHEEGLTLKELAALIGFSVQHISEVELAQAPMSARFVAACDLALKAQGDLLDLLEAVICERAIQRQQESLARQRADGALSDAEWEALAGTLWLGRYAGRQYLSAAGEAVDLSRRNILEAGVGAVLGLGTSFATTVPVSSGAVDPELVGHWERLLRVLYRHDAMFGPRDVLDAVCCQVGFIVSHRRVASGEMHTRLLRVESRYAEFASWLSNDVGDVGGRDGWAVRATDLAREIDYQDMVAWMHLWRSRWAVEERDARGAIAFAEAAGRTPGMSDKLRALCALKGAQGHALASDTASCNRSLSAAYVTLERVSSETDADDLGAHAVTPYYVLADEAHCLRPRKAAATFEEVLRLWPHDRPRGRGVQQGRLALAYAASNEPERAAAEGIKALSIAQTTKSDVIVRQLKRLDRELAGCDTAGVADFRAAVTTV